MKIKITESQLKNLKVFLMKEVSETAIRTPEDEIGRPNLHVYQQDPNREKNIDESSDPREDFSDLFTFIANDPQKGSTSIVYYTSPVAMNKGGRGGTEVNPYFGKIFKESAFNFRWEDTYKKAVGRDNPEHEMGKRSGSFEKIQGYNVLESGKNGLYLPIIPLNLGNSTVGYLIMNDNGQLEPIDTETIKPYFKPSRNYQPASGTDFRLLMVNRVSKIKAGGKDWNNPHFSFK